MSSWRIETPSGIVYRLPEAMHPTSGLLEALVAIEVKATFLTEMET